MLNRFIVTLAGLATVAGTALVGTAAMAQGGPGFMADLYGDATVTRAEAQAQAAAQFDKMDTGHAGLLSAAQLEALGPRVSRMIQRADSNSDGKLTKDEWLASALKRFDRMDANHDGSLTKAERDAVRAEMMQRMQQMRGMQNGGNESPGQ